MPAAETVERLELIRTLGLRDIILLLIGVVVGSGIFVVPAQTIRATGGYSGLMAIAWMAGGALTILGALTFAEMSAMSPCAGGMYAFIRDAFGRLPAFLYGWILFFVIGPGTIAAVAVATATCLGELVPLSHAVNLALPIAMITILGLVNVVGVRHSATLTNATTVFKIIPVVLICAALLARGDVTHLRPFWPSTFNAAVFSGIGGAMLGVLWAYEGWQWVTFSAGETTNPQRVLPRGFAIGTAVVVAVYLLANIAFLSVLGPVAAGQSTHIGADAAHVALGPVASKLVAATIVVAMLSSANGSIASIPRAFYAMAQDGLFFRRLGLLHRHFRTPTTAIIVLCAMAILYALTGTFEQLLTYVVFCGWLFYALAAAAIFIFRRRQPLLARPYRVPGYPFTPAAFIAFALVVVVNTVITQPLRAAVGLAIVVAGIPVFSLWQHMSGRDGK